jgi:hypothetical protein
MAGYFELRPNVFFELYVDADLWARYIKTPPPETDRIKAKFHLISCRE